MKGCFLYPQRHDRPRRGFVFSQRVELWMSSPMRGVETKQRDCGLALSELAGLSRRQKILPFPLTALSVPDRNEERGKRYGKGAGCLRHQTLV